MPSTIVVPLDESEISETAIPLAKAFAADSGASVLLVSVVDVSTEFASWLGDSTDAEDLQRERARTQEYLDGVASRFDGANVQTIVRAGRPEVEILDVLDETAEPIVVMSSHGRSGFNRVLVGSVAGRIVSGADCPVVVVRATDDGKRAPDMDSIDTILVPLDGSTFAEYALEAAQESLASKKLQIHLVRIPETVTWATTPGMTGAASYQMIDTYMEASTEEATAYLTEVAGRLKERGHSVNWEVRHGVIADEIAAAADEHKVDLVVIATHGRTGFRRIVMGSVAERVLHEASAPLMMVRPQDED
ncbi:MAG TPA: universal stress protein [Thermomicrobiales bacterium]|nr:universal stress protein [Thermomicrobiales bacterium]